MIVVMIVADQKLLSQGPHVHSKPSHPTLQELSLKGLPGD